MSASIPWWHDVGPILIEQAERFPDATRAQLAELARISHWLRKEREFSFYGDVDFIPTEQYSAQDADRAIVDANYAFEAAKQLIEAHP
jgi:HEPN domain-containing protein